MQFLEFTYDSTLLDLSDRVSHTYIDSILAANSLTRATNIGEQLYEKVQACYNSTTEIDYQRQATILNGLVSDDDVFEMACLLNSSDWKVLSNYGTFPEYLQIPDTVTLPDAADIMGSGVPVTSTVYQQAMDYLYNSDDHSIDPIVFNSYSNIKDVQISSVASATSGTNVMTTFPIPWDACVLYSNLGGDSVNMPGYPEEVGDGVSADYETMPDLIYNYEPWYLYKSSGPREITLTWQAHRDMWSGDHTDGAANDLIRFCESFCYPEYSGAAVYSDTCSLYINGSCFINGIITAVDVDWSGPIGQDGWYLYFELKLHFTEISSTELSRTTMRNKSIIG